MRPQRKKVKSMPLKYTGCSRDKKLYCYIYKNLSMQLNSTEKEIVGAIKIFIFLTTA